MQLQTPCPSKITCRPARRQTLNATNEFTFCALAAPFVPTVQVLCNWDQEKFGHTCETQMFSPPVPCLQPTPKPLSPAARRPACQAHIQRSRGFDTSASAACQTPMNVHKLCTSKGGNCTLTGPSNGHRAQPAAHAATSSTSLENIVTESGILSHGSLPPVHLSDIIERYQRYPLSPAKTAVDYEFQRPRSLHATVLPPGANNYNFVPAPAISLSSGALNTMPRPLALSSSATNRSQRTVPRIPSSQKAQMSPTKPPTTPVHG